MSETAFELETMVPAPAAASTVRPLITTEDGVLLCYGTAAYTVLEADTSTYAPGCIYIKSLTAGTSIIYFNVGTKAAPNFDTASWS